MYGFSVKIAAADYAETYGINARTAYDELKYVAKTLIKRQWTVVDGRTTAHYNWLSGVKYHDGQGWMEMHYTHWISPHLYFLRKQFTTYRLEQAAALRSAYSWRLFECLMSWRDTGKWSPSLDDFYRAMDIKKDSPYRKNFAHLRRRVLDPSLRELRDKDGWDVTCEFVKGGRRVVGLSFKFSPARQGRLDF
jgi:plasmid replication initiation protein